jgi:molybdenum cofactor biosynthesis enzyme MoaA
MNYRECRRVGLPIGSGVTEAACKTIVNYRFKQSGMRWHCVTGQHVLDLRVILKSGVWRRIYRTALGSYTPYHLAAPAAQKPAYLVLPAIFQLPT